MITKEQAKVALAMVEADDMGVPPFADEWTADQHRAWIASSLRLAIIALDGENDRPTIDEAREELRLLLWIRNEEILSNDGDETLGRMIRRAEATSHALKAPKVKR